jgi:hypothetical protein
MMQRVGSESNLFSRRSASAPVRARPPQTGQTLEAELSGLARRVDSRDDFNTREIYQRSQVMWIDAGPIRKSKFNPIQAHTPGDVNLLKKPH